MSHPANAVFLSYASQDAEAARRICEALRAAGVEVWFDQNELVGGDAWDQKIRRQIKECALFVPVISANTEARPEGYFRLEWLLAVERARLMADDHPFLFPIAIGDVHQAAARVPERFRDVQWSSVRLDETPAELALRVAKLLTGSVERPSASQAAAIKATSAAAQKRGRGMRWRWAVLPVAGVLLASAWALKVFWLPKRATVDAKPAVTSVQSETQQLVARAWSLLNKPELSRPELDTADELCRRAAALDPTDAEVQAVWSQVDSWTIYQKIDESAARQALARNKAARALQLAPQSFEVRLAHAAYLVRGRGDRGLPDNVGETETLLRALLRERHDEPRTLLALGILLRNAGRRDESKKVFETLAANPAFSALGWNEVGWLLFNAGEMAAAEEAVAKSLAAQPYWANLTLQAYLAADWRGDLDGMKAAFDRMPESFRRSEQGVNFALGVHYIRRDVPACLRLLEEISGDWIEGYNFGPKAGWATMVHRLGGRDEARRLAAEAALRAIDQRLATTPSVWQLLEWKGFVLAELGQADAAEQLYRRARETQAEPGWMFEVREALALKRVEKAVDVIEREVAKGPKPDVTAATLRLHPWFDPLQDMPRFKALRARLEADPRFSPTARTPRASENIPAAPAPSEKSLVVLPLENLSPDPENAFFTDGMHFEITTTVARLADLKVISRDSALALKSAGGSLAEKAQKVGVANVITGSVRRAGTSVRVSLELRRAHDEALLWSQTYNKELGDGVLEIQSDIADQVARVLQARERKGTYAGARTLARDARAYDLFLKARHLFDTNDLRSSTIIETLEEALRIDPTFMSAAALLSTTHSRLRGRWNQDAPTRAHHAAEAKRWAEAAARLVPGGAGDGSLAVYFAVIEHDYVRALSYAEKLIHALPNEATGYDYAAKSLAKLGRFSEGVTLSERAISLDPLNPLYWQNQLAALTSLRRAPAAFEALARYQVLLPPGRARFVAEYTHYRLNGTLPADGSADQTTSTFLWRMRKFDELLVKLDRLLEGQITDELRFAYLQQKSRALQHLGHREKARLPAEAALALANGPALDTDDAPDAQEIRRAQALALLGRADEAIAIGRRCAEAASGPNQILLRWEREFELAEIYATLKRPRECCELLGKLLGVPSDVTVPQLKVDPIWDNVRDDPAFKVLLADPKNSAPL